MTVCLVLVLPRTVCHVPGRFVAGGHGVSGSGRGSVWVGMGSVATGTEACVVTDWVVTGFRSWRGGRTDRGSVWVLMEVVCMLAALE